MEKLTDSRIGYEIYKMNLEHLVVPERSAQTNKQKNHNNEGMYAKGTGAKLKGLLLMAKAGRI